MKAENNNIPAEIWEKTIPITPILRKATRYTEIIKIISDSNISC